MTLGGYIDRKTKGRAGATIAAANGAGYQFGSGSGSIFGGGLGTRGGGNWGGGGSGGSGLPPGAISWDGNDTCGPGTPQGCREATQRAFSEGWAELFAWFGRVLNTPTSRPYTRAVTVCGPGGPCYLLGYRTAPLTVGEIVELSTLPLGPLAAGMGRTATGEQIIARIAQSHADSGIAGLNGYLIGGEVAAVARGARTADAMLGSAVHRATARTLERLYPGRFDYSPTRTYDFVDNLTGQAIELTTVGGAANHAGRFANIVTYVPGW